MAVIAEPSVDELLQEAKSRWTCGATQEAEALCRRALQRNPTHAEALCLLGRIASRYGNLSIAAAFLTKAVAITPEEPSYHARLGSVYLRQNQLERAAMHCCRALELDPSYSRAYVNLGVVLLNEGRVEEAIVNFRHGLELHPDDADVHTNLLFSLHYLPEATRTELLELAQDWGRRHAPATVESLRRHSNVPDPDRRLRVGYVSGNFAAHPVGYFLEPVLAAHQREAFEVYCYTNRNTVDQVTQRLRQSADYWRNVTDLSDEDAAQLVRQDEIDLLIDLSGHTSWHRLQMFAQKPAPVQASWLGYFDTTGVAALDYLIADRFVCPPGDDQFYTERIVRLPDCYLCYGPQTDLEVGEPPSARQGGVVFGCFNKLAKITPIVIRTWTAILQALPDSRLVLKDSGFEHGSVRVRLLRQFAEAGIDPQRIELRGRSSHQEYLASYGEVDVALDPFPYNGGTTTVEALWMGVPVVTLAGDRFVSRMGLAHLTTIGLGDLVAQAPDDYVQIAVRLAGDQQRLTQLRSELRKRVSNSSLCDRSRFVSGLEAAYRAMWRSWCEASGAA